MAVQAPSNLPAELDTFIGRHRALAQARRLTERARLVTLTGPGGVGKTRLALRLATQATHSPSAYPDGVWLLSLGELTDATQLADALTNVLALPAQHTAHSHDLGVVLATLRARRMLLVIDNCEHLVSAVAAAVRCVLSAAPGIRVLATSRIPLQLPGEHLMPVPPLSLEHGQDPSEAVQLLREQARAVNAELGEDDLADAERLCRRLDGIPLAITLAAARLPSVGVKDLADSVTDGGRCPLLDTGEHYGQPWHRSLASAHDWSYSLCSREEQLVWERLSVFEGSFEPSSVERIFADAGLTTALLRRLLVRLVDQSVLLADITGGTSRYRMLDSVRACGALRLSERDSAEQQRLRQAHAEYYLDLARQGTDEIGRRREIDWVRRLQLEAPNLLAAAEYLLAAGQPNQALDLAVELARTRWAFVTGQLDRTRDLLRRTLDAQHTVHPLQVAARVLAACLDLHQGSDAQAEAELAAADACTRTLGEQPALRSWVLLGRGLQLLARRDPTSLTVLQQAHDLWRQHVAPHSPYPGRGVRMWAAALLGDATTARQELDAPRSEPDASVLEDAWNQWCCGVTELRHGNPHLAAELLTGNACQQLQLGDRWGSAWSVEALAWAAAACRHDEQAAVLLGAAHHRLPTTNAVMGMGPAADLHEQWTTATRARLAEAFDDAFTHGTTLDDTALLAYLRELPDPAQHSEKPPGGLTDREYEIASLIAAGLTNKQIAEKLFVSIRTVDTHAESIRTKLGIFGTGARLKIARWWGQQQP